MGGGLATSDNINFSHVASHPLISNGGYIQQGNVGNAGNDQSSNSQASGGSFNLGISASPQLGLQNLEYYRTPANLRQPGPMYGWGLQNLEYYRTPANLRQPGPMYGWGL